MFDVAPSELLLVALVALVVIGPKDLPRVMRTVGRFVAQARGMARHFRAGLDEMIRQAEIEEMEAKWAEENARIMREHPLLPDGGDVAEAADETQPPDKPAPRSRREAIARQGGGEDVVPAAGGEAELPFDKPL